MKRTAWGWAPRQLMRNGVRAAAKQLPPRSWVGRDVPRGHRQTVADQRTRQRHWLAPTGLLAVVLALGAALARLGARVRARRLARSASSAMPRGRRTAKVETTTLGEVIAARALTLEGVTQRRMFGCDAWLVHGKMFGFLGDMGLVVKPPPELRDTLLARPGASVFEVRPGVPFGRWVTLPLADTQQEEAALAALDRSYYNVRDASQAERPRRRVRRRNVAG